MRGLRLLAWLFVLALVAGACGDSADTTTTTGARESTISTPASATTTSVRSAVTTTSPPVAGDTRRPVILDYSPTVSDIGALVFLATHPQLRLVGVTLPGTGESYCDEGVAHTRGVLTRLGLGEVPVACGPDEPVTGFNAFPTSWRVDSSEMNLPKAPPNETRSAAELIIGLARSSDRPVEVVAVGPLTNVALALEADPQLAGELAGITIMGGAVEVPGNVFRNDVAEWNVWVDPTAAGLVLASDAPVTLIPLDATNFLPTSPVFFEALEEQADRPAAELVRDVWRARPDWYENRDGFFYFWDELAAAVLVDESLVTFETRNLVVDDDLRETKGWTRQDPAGSPVRVALAADRVAFETLFLGTIVGRPAGLRYLEATADEVAYFEAFIEIGMEFDAAFEALVEATADDLGLSESSSSDEDFLLVLAAALPAIFDGLLPDYVHRLEAVDPPPALTSAHETYVTAESAFLGSGDDLLTAFEANPSFEVLGPALEPVRQACAALQYEADRRLLDMDLLCP